jgi:hypothetical protein
MSAINRSTEKYVVRLGSFVIFYSWRSHLIDISPLFDLHTQGSSFAQEVKKCFNNRTTQLSSNLELRLNSMFFKHRPQAGGLAMYIFKNVYHKNY